MDYTNLLEQLPNDPRAARIDNPVGTEKLPPGKSFHAQPDVMPVPPEQIAAENRQAGAHMLQHILGIAGTEGLGAADKLALQSAFKGFHGSPASFDKFALDFLGKGQGQAAHGTGINIASAEPVAQAYRHFGEPFELSANGQIINPGGEIPKDLAHPNVSALHKFFRVSGNLDKAVAAQEPIVEWAAKNAPNVLPTEAEILRILTKEAPNWQYKKPGYMYEVGVEADPSKFIDWTAPVPSAVRDKLAADVEQHYGNIAPDVRHKILTGGEQSGEELRENLRESFFPAHAQGTGRAWEKVREYPDSQEAKAADLFASKVLDYFGIPGYKWADSGARTGGPGKGSTNYTVFNPDIIKILRKYGILIGTPGAAAAGAAASGNQNPAAQ